MRTAAKFLTAGAFALLLAVGAPPTPKTVLAQAGQQPGQSTPTFRASVDLITTDMIARNSRTEQFIADLNLMRSGEARMAVIDLEISCSP